MIHYSGEPALKQHGGCGGDTIALYTSIWFVMHTVFECAALRQEREVELLT